MQEVEALAASGHPIRNLIRNCSAVQPDSDQPWPQDGHLLRRHLAIVKQTLLDWRQRVLDTLEATGFRHDDCRAAQLNTSGGAVRLQLEGTFVQDVIDAQDLACAFLQPDSSLRAAMQVGVDCQVQLIRWVCYQTAAICGSALWTFCSCLTANRCSHTGQQYC